MGEERTSANYRELTPSSDGILHASGYLLELGYSEVGMLPCCRDQLLTQQMSGPVEYQVF